jgi:hypothetical protein
MLSWVNGYFFGVNLHLALAAMNTARAFVAEHQLRRSRIREFRAFCSGATVVFTGLLMAVLYCLLTHRIPV